MRPCIAALLGLAQIATVGHGQEKPNPEIPAEPAVPAPGAPDAVVPPVGPGIPPVPAPEAPAEPDIGEPETTHGSPASKTDAAAPPESKALEWEKNIVRVSVFDDTRSIALPVEGKEAMSGAGDSKLPKVVSPYPPKPLSPVPEGWQLRTDTSVPVRVHRVKFKDGRTLDIGVFPPALMPANPDATTVVLPQSAGNLSGAIRSARQDQAASRAKLEALLEAISLQLPASAAEAPPVP